MVLPPICLVLIVVKELTKDIEALKEALASSQLQKAEQVTPQMTDTVPHLEVVRSNLSLPSHLDLDYEFCYKGLSVLLRKLINIDIP